MNYRTPINQAKGLGSAKEGGHHWWMQRLTALALIPLTFWFAFTVATMATSNFQEMTQWISNPWVAGMMVLFFVISYYHGALGMQVILEDYVSSHSTRTVMVILSKFALAVLGVVSVLAIFKIMATG